MDIVEKARTIGIIVKDRPRHRLGSEAPTTYVKGEKGQADIMVLSDGLLEQAEVDYLVEIEKEKEAGRVRQKQSALKEDISHLVDIAQAAPRGQRNEAITEAINNS